MRTHGHREGSITHWGLSGGNRGGTVQGGELGRDSMGRNADIGDGEEGRKSHCHVCTYAKISHVLHMYPKPKMQFKKKKNKFESFAGTWMKLETIIFSKLTEEQKTKPTCSPS